MQVLSWIICAKRPLTTFELRHALAVEVGETKLNEHNLPEIEDMVSVCAGLVTVDEESDIIRLVHYTTQEYLEQTQNRWFPNAVVKVTTICVTYLSFSVFESGFCQTDSEFEDRLQLNPLYGYAAHNWGYHARAASAEAEHLITQLLESEAKVSSSCQAMMASGEYSQYSQHVPRQVIGVHLAAYFGLKEAMIALLKNRYDLDSKDTHGRTPLSYAAESGHEVMVKLLLEKGAKLEIKDKKYNQTPLLWAVKKRHEAVVKLLLEKGAELEIKDKKYKQTPLSYAAEKGHEAMVKLLLEKGAELETESKSGQTPLSYAAAYGHEAVVELLVVKGAELETPLSYAAAYGHEAVVKLLLEKGAKLEIKDKKYHRTPLSWAIKKGHKVIINLLIEKGAKC